MGFWIGVSAIGLAVLVILARALWRDTTGKANLPSDLLVYRDQLAEVDRDLERGVLSEEAADRSRAEVGRRILSADRNRSAVAKSGIPAPALVGAFAFCAATLAGSAWLYLGLGQPGVRDLPLSLRIERAEEARAGRPTQEQAEAAVPTQPSLNADPRLAELVDRLRIILADRPGDVEGLTLLARNEATLGNFAAARVAQERLIAAKGNDATLGDLVTLADLMVFAAGGVVTPEADAVLSTILAENPDNPLARYYVGLLHAQTGRPDLTFSFWRPLLESGPQDAPWIGPIRASIEDLARIAGVRYTLPPEPTAAAPLPGPTAEDIDAASDMSADDRTAMIRGMVDGLAERLASEGGTAEEWGRLLNALGVLGETQRAGAIWAEAQQVFANDPQALVIVREGAVAAGVAQ